MLRVVLFTLVLALPLVGYASSQSEIDAIHRVIDRYGATQDAMDLKAQGDLMAPDRVWFSQWMGRRTDNVLNMRIQQADLDAMKKAIPGVQTFSEDRERLIKFYGDGKVAVASFFRYVTRIFPAGTSPELMKQYAVDSAPEAISLVLEKRGAQWIIVHTHVSTFGAD